MSLSSGSPGFILFLIPSSIAISIPANARYGLLAASGRRNSSRFVVARGEGVRLLGCQYESSVFPDRAPSGGVLLRALLGGSFEPSLVDEDDATLAGTAVADLRRTAGLRRDPDFVDVWRARPGIPQYDRGHLARVHAVDAAIAALPGLRVIGHALRGVGVSACIAAAGECARAIAFPR